VKIEQHLLLEGLSLVDFSTRLPGPLASSYLKDLGAKIYRPEETFNSDPFDHHPDIAFNYWFNKLSEGKEVLKGELEEIIKTCDGIIITWTQSKQFSKLFKAIDKPFVILEIQASKNIKKKSLHDLNSIAESGLLKLQINNEHATPPCIPIAGVQFGNQIALNFLSGILKSKQLQRPIKIEIALDEVVEQLTNYLLPPSGQLFLHNGKFPCYQIYPTQKPKQYLIVAAIETKFWLEFITFLNLNELKEMQFSEDAKVFSKIKEHIASMAQDQLEKMCHDHKCLSLITTD